MLRLLYRWLALLVCVGVLSACGGPYTFQGDVYDDIRAAPDFTLTDHNGQPFHIADQRGKVVLLFFGYTHCPDVCLSALSDLAKVRRELGRDAAHVRVAFVSVDPDRDVPTLLGRYVTAFDPTFVGLRGSQVELEPIYKAYRVQVVRTELPNSAFKYAMDHSMFIYVIDQAGRLRERFVHGATIEDMTNDVRHLVRTGGA